jgi:hypothetical protein
MTLHIAYGFRSDLPAFVGLSPEEAGHHLRALGCDGVFMHEPGRAWVDGLHATGLRVYAELGVFSGQGVWERFPDSRPITGDGTPAPREEWYEPAIPTLAELRAHRLRDLETLIQSAPLDGLWLDFIRWPARWERPQPRLYHSSFDPVTLAQFQADTGVRLPENASEKDFGSLDDRLPKSVARWILTHAAGPWFAWRCQQIVSFVAEARACLGQTHKRQHLPQATLGVFTVPWTDADFDGAFIRIIGQDPALLAPHVDIFSPMVYHRMCGRDLGWTGAITRWVQERSHRAVWPIVEAVAPAEDYPAAEFAAACRAALDASGEGVMVFTLEGLLQDPARIEAWKSLH